MSTQTDADKSADEWGELGKRANESAQEMDKIQCHHRANCLRECAAQAFDFEFRLRTIAILKTKTNEHHD